MVFRRSRRSAVEAAAARQKAAGSPLAAGDGVRATKLEMPEVFDVEHAAKRVQ